MHKTLPAMTFMFSHILIVHCHKFPLMKLFLVHSALHSHCHSSQRAKVPSTKLFPVCSLLPSTLSSIFNHPPCTLQVAIRRCLLCDCARPDLRYKGRWSLLLPLKECTVSGQWTPHSSRFTYSGKFTYMWCLTLKGNISW